MIGGCRDLKGDEWKYLCDVEIFVPNALSHWAALSVVAGGAWWTMKFRKGKVFSPFTAGEPATEPGVRVEFELDPRFFRGAHFDAEVRHVILRRVQATVPCARVVVRDS